jgi:hypothetical protein
MFPLFYQASIQLGLFLALWTGFEYVRLGSRGRRAITVLSNYFPVQK